MYKNLLCVASIVLVLSLSAAVSYAQLLGVYDFDGGGDGTSWDDPNNWEQVSDPNGAPISGNPATPPDGLTTATLPLAGVVVDMAGQTALDVKIGTTGGAGSLTLSAGGALAAGRDFNVGAGDPNGSANGGTFTMTGGTLSAGDDIFVGLSTVGTMNMSLGSVDVGDDFFIQNTSTFNMTGGSVHIGDRLVMTDDASLTLSTGDIVADDDFFFFGSSQVTVNGSLMEVKDKLRFDNVLTTGKLTVNGGVVRSQEFGFCATSDCSTSYVMNGTVEINGDGVYQSQRGNQLPGQPVSQLTLVTAQALIDDGTFITSEVLPLFLRPRIVTVPDFFGTLNLEFVEVFVAPEPSSVLLLGLGSLGLLVRRKRAR